MEAYHIGPNQYGAVGIGKIQIIKWQCSSENYLHSNVLMRFRQVAIARQVEIAMQSNLSDPFEKKDNICWSVSQSKI